MKGKQQRICVLLNVENGRLKKKKDRGGEGGEASALLPAAKTQSCASALYKTPFLEVKRTHARTHTHTLCTVILHTQRGDSKQVALKCYDVVRWHAKTINIYSIYTQD